MCCHYQNFEGLISITDYDDIQKEFEANEIEHYTMQSEGEILPNPMLYIIKDNIFVGMESIPFEETGNTSKEHTHCLLKLKEK